VGGLLAYDNSDGVLDVLSICLENHRECIVSGGYANTTRTRKERCGLAKKTVSTA
jgi:hypothetical protein